MTNSTRCTLLSKQACTTLSHVVQKITPPSANNFLKLFFALFAMLTLGVGNAWGANYEIVAKKGSGDGSSLGTSTKVTDVFSNGTYVANFTTATKSYYNGSNGLKLGTSSSAGDLKFTLTDEGKVKATTIIVSAKRYNTSNSVTLQVIAGGVTCTAKTISNSANFTD